MICNRFLQVASRRALSSQTRSISRTSILSSTATNPLSASASSVATAPSSPRSSLSPRKPLQPGDKKKDKGPAIPKSSIPAGKVLKGLNLLKGKQDPTAMADEDYPPWLWTLVTESKSSGAGSADAQGDLYGKSAKQRRVAAKALRKREAALAASGVSLEPPVPLQEQSIDLPVGDSTGTSEATLQLNMQASSARQEVTKAMRQQRRAKIKESNFLTSMS